MWKFVLTFPIAKIVLSGIVGSGKTTLLLQVQRELKQESKVVVSRSISVDINNG
ncbi:GTP-binding protein [Capilliphycus salinus ALCB114379]|uniref:GTP-binding protein n=1 Tax=Capilliphycus salinus TaxID=2768948 RepID=UPI0039A5F741